MASPNERKLRKLALMKKVRELNGTAAASTVVGAVVDVVEVVEDVVEDVVEVVEDVTEVVVEAAEDVVEDVVEAVKEVVSPRKKKRSKKSTK